MTDRQNYSVTPDPATHAPSAGETVSSGNGIGATALATLLHERCQEDWQRRFDNGAQAITMHDVSAHDETARWLAARGVTVGLDVERLAAALHEVHGGGPCFTRYRNCEQNAAAIARAYAATPAQPEPDDTETLACGCVIDANQTLMTCNQHTDFDRGTPA